jgi:hypothetical protein
MKADVEDFVQQLGVTMGPKFYTIEFKDRIRTEHYFYSILN